MRFENNKNLQEQSVKKDDNEWEEAEKEVEVPKTTFKIEGKDVEDLQKTVEKEPTNEESAHWDEGDPEFLKAQVSAKIEEPKSETIATKNASSIEFASDKPTFGGFSSGPPKFMGTSSNSMKSSGLSKKVVNSEAFPELGEVAPPSSSKKESEKKKSNGAPKFTSHNKNRFDQLPVHATNKEEKKIEKIEKIEKVEKVDREERPKREKDEFFGNFRSANKDVGTKEPEQPTKHEPVISSGSNKPPVFSNKASGKMTMAKAQEEALKKKKEEDKKVAKESKPSKSGSKPEKKKLKQKEKKVGRFDMFETVPEKKKKTEFKPKVKKVEVEKADLGDNEWGKDKLEDLI